MGIFDTFSKLQGTLKKALVTPLERAFSTHVSTGVIGQVIERISSRLSGLTPLTAPTILFTPSSGLIKQEIAFEGHWRYFLVEVANQGEGELPRNSTEAPYNVDITIEIGYPEFPGIKVGSAMYSVPVIKAEDARTIDAMMWADVLSSPSQIAGAGLREMGGWYDVGNTKRRGRYVFEITES